MTLKNKVAIVTGASRGIGKSIAIALARHGADVVVASRNRDELREVEAQLQRFGCQSMIIPTDLKNEAEINQLVDKTLKIFNKIDILINNAGLGIFKNVVDFDVSDWDLMWQINVRAMFLCTKAVLPHMIENNQGAVVNIASLAGKNGFATGAGYCATKFAVMGFSKSLLLEVRKHNIRVITVCPGSVDTPFFDHTPLTPNRETILQPQEVGDTIIAALMMPARATISEIEIRPTNP